MRINILIQDGLVRKISKKDLGLKIGKHETRFQYYLTNEGEKERVSLTNRLLKLLEPKILELVESRVHPSLEPKDYDNEELDSALKYFCWEFEDRIDLETMKQVVTFFKKRLGG